MKYVKKIEAVEVVRFAPETIVKPEFIQETGESFMGNPVFYDAESGAAYALVNTPDGTKRIYPGDFVLVADNGLLSVCSPEELRLKYDAVSDNFKKNSEGFLNAYRKALVKLKEGGKKLLSADEKAGSVEYKSGDVFDLFVRIERVKSVKGEEKVEPEPKEDKKVKKDGGV